MKHASEAMKNAQVLNVMCDLREERLERRL